MRNSPRLLQQSIVALSLHLCFAFLCLSAHAVSFPKISWREQYLKADPSQVVLIDFVEEVVLCIWMLLCAWHSKKVIFTICIWEYFGKNSVSIWITMELILHYRVCHIRSALLDMVTRTFSVKKECNYGISMRSFLFSMHRLVRAKSLRS